MAVDYLSQESALTDHILLEDGSGAILLESSVDFFQPSSAGRSHTKGPKGLQYVSQKAYVVPQQQQPDTIPAYCSEDTVDVERILDDYAPYEFYCDSFTPNRIDDQGAKEYFDFNIVEDQFFVEDVYPDYYAQAPPDVDPVDIPPSLEQDEQPEDQPYGFENPPPLTAFTPVGGGVARANNSTVTVAVNNVPLGALVVAFATYPNSFTSPVTVTDGSSSVFLQDVANINSTSGGSTVSAVFFYCLNSLNSGTVTYTLTVPGTSGFFSALAVYVYIPDSAPVYDGGSFGTSGTTTVSTGNVSTSDTTYNELAVGGYSDYGTAAVVTESLIGLTPSQSQTLGGGSPLVTNSSLEIGTPFTGNYTVTISASGLKPLVNIILFKLSTEHLPVQLSNDQLADEDEFAEGFSSDPLSANALTDTPQPEFSNPTDEDEFAEGFTADPISDDVLDPPEPSLVVDEERPDEEWFGFDAPPLPDDNDVGIPESLVADGERPDEEWFGFDAPPLSDDNDVGIPASLEQEDQPEDEPFGFDFNVTPDDVLDPPAPSLEQEEQPEDEPFGFSVDPIPDDFVLPPVFQYLRSKGPYGLRFVSPKPYVFPLPPEEPPIPASLEQEQQPEDEDFGFVDPPLSDDYPQLQVPPVRGLPPYGLLFVSPKAYILPQAPTDQPPDPLLEQEQQPEEEPFGFDIAPAPADVFDPPEPSLEIEQPPEPEDFAFFHAPPPADNDPVQPDSIYLSLDIPDEDEFFEGFSFDPLPEGVETPPIEPWIGVEEERFDLEDYGFYIPPLADTPETPPIEGSFVQEEQPEDQPYGFDLSPLSANSVVGPKVIKFIIKVYPYPRHMVVSETRSITVPPYPRIVIVKSINS